MKYCVLCDRSYPDESVSCEVDGSTLRISRPGADPFVGKVINGRYRVLEKLGEGGMSIVYAGEQINVARKVALKIMHGQYSNDQEFVRRFRQEARLAASLNHPNIVQVYDFDQAEDGTLFIAMEYLQGTNLKDLIRQKPLGVSMAVRLGIQIAEGLASAHRAGVIHRDIKPENIMVLRSEQQIKLLDFGIARLGEAGSTTSRLTQAGMMMGTPAYMAPEQIEGAEVTERTDIYALGIVFYEMLCGVAPFRAPTPAAVLMKHLREIATPPRKLRKEIPVALERIITQAMEKQPERRQANAQEVAVALRSARAKLPEEFPQTAFLSPEILDSGEINATVFSPEARKSPLQKLGSWFKPRTRDSQEKRIADRAPSSPTEHLSEATDMPAIGATIAETVITPQPLDATRERRAHWKLAVGAVGLVVLMGLAVTIFFRPVTKEQVPPIRVDTPVETPATTDGEKIRLVTIQGNREELLVGQQEKFAVSVERENGKRAQPTEEVRWESSNPSILANVGGGEFIARNAGIVEITAEYQGVKAVPIMVTVKEIPEPVPIRKVEVVSLAIDPARAQIDVNERLALRVTGRYSDGREQLLKEVRWESSDRNVAAIQGSGELEGRRAGTARITAMYGGVRSQPLIVSVKAPEPKDLPVRAAPPRAPQAVSSPRQEPAETKIPEPAAPPRIPEAASSPRQERAEIKEPPVQKAKAPQVSIREYMAAAKKYRDRGDYAAALAELEKAKRVDQNNPEIQAEIVQTTRACNAERILVRPDLKC
jgi:serine/threonine protein kinase